METRRRFPPWVVPVAGYAVAVICLIWVYRGFDWAREWQRIRTTNWGWVTLAVIADVVIYVCQGWRWSVLLRPLEYIPFLKSTQAVYIGLFANEVLPFRSGEVIRCYLLKRWTGLPLSVVLSSALIERMLDGMWLVVGFWFVSRYVALPGPLIVGSRVLIFLLLVVAALVAMAVLYKGHAQTAASMSRWSTTLHHIIDGVHTMGRSPSFVLAAVLSFFYLALQLLPVYFLMRGYGLDLTVWEAGVVLVVLRLGTIVPQAPGNVGSFQALTILGLRVAGVARPDAIGFATLLFIVVTVPLWVVGFIALLATRMRLDEIHRDAHAHFAQER